MRHLRIRVTTKLFATLTSPVPFLFTLLLFVGGVHAQTKNDSKEVYDRIAALDAAMFEASNACDIDKVGNFFTEDLEFYHEKGGLVLTRKSVLDIMKTNLCGENSNRVRRELVKGSMEVHLINNYGAVQTGEHRFYLTQKGQKEKLDGIGKFVMIWHNKNGEWRISRVVSYGFRAPE